MESVGKRERKIKTETPTQAPRKWREEEMEILLDCLMRYGHKNFEKMQECLPDRSLENIKLFMRTVYDTAGKLTDGHPNLDLWINHCNYLSVKEPAWKDSLQIAQVLKYLSVDGLLENHPVPERCQGVNFGGAYRLIYQALMGYPIQPVNEATTKFVREVINELTNEVNKEMDATKNVSLFLMEKFKTISTKPTENSETKPVVKKPLRVYQRKRPNVTPVEDTPPLKIVVQTNPSELSGSSMLQDFSLTFEGQKEGSQPTVVNVQVPVTHVKSNEDEQELLKSASYNPFQIPEKWLQEPVFLNLQKKL